MAAHWLLLFRTELATADVDFLEHFIFGQVFGDTGASLFNTFISLHGMIMIVTMLLGVGALSNYLVPLMIGANDMAFPRLNAFAFWINVPGAVVLLASMFAGGFDTGWTGYPPNSTGYSAMGVSLFMLAVYIVGFSSIFGSLNVIVTIFRMRVPGMKLFEMPIFVWAAMATAFIQLIATQFIGLSFLMVILQRLFGMNFFDSTAGGDPVLFQHLFWFYSHPAVYVFILPGLGIISELLPVFVRKPLFGYKWIALSSLGIALVGYFVWAHHMFTAGMASYLRVPFMYSTLLVAIPTGVKFFSWVGTMWRGKMRINTPMLFVLGSVVVFLMGGVTGPPNATVATDLHLHDTYWIVGHFHNTMFGGFMFPWFAAIYYYFPKITGRKMNEFWGQLHFWLMVPAFLVMSLYQMLTGLLGMRRRIAGYDPALGIEGYQLVVTVAGFLIFFAVVIFAVNFVLSARRGEVAEGNIWESRSPVWQLPNPIPLHNYEKPFRVVGDPYGYGDPGGRPYVDMDPSDDVADEPTTPSDSEEQQAAGGADAAPAPAGD